MAAFASVAVVCSCAVGWHVAVAGQPAPDVVTTSVRDGDDGTVDLTFAGDTMLGDGALKLIAAQGIAAPLTKVVPLLRGDVTVVNAEGPLSVAAPPANPGAKYSYGVDPAAGPAMHAAGIDVLALGNNHAMDRGARGLAETQSVAARAGMSTFGAGRNRAEASRPLILRGPRQTVALVGFGENFGPQHRSTETSAGMVPLSPQRIEQAVLTARRAGASRVVAVVHWGDNYAEVNPQQRYWAGLLVNAGYDAVIGTGSHTLQPVELVHGVPVAFGLGNLAFGAPGRFAAYGKAGIGAVAHLRWAADGVGSVRFDCVQTDNLMTGYLPRPCPPPQLQTARRTLGPAVTWQGETAVATFR